MFSEHDKELLNVAADNLISKYEQTQEKVLERGIPTGMEKLQTTIKSTTRTYICEVNELRDKLLKAMEVEK